jgi:predicted outer membrane repeat protein
VFSCWIVDNYAEGNGGGIHTDNSTLILTDVVIQRNTAEHHGGGLFVRTQGDVTINANSGILDNRALMSGGGIFVQLATVNISDNSKINGNEALDEGGGIFSRGLLTMLGGELINNRVTGSVVNNILVGGLGGGFYSKNTATFDDVTICCNEAVIGGAGYVFDVVTTISNSFIEDNIATISPAIDVVVPGLYIGIDNSGNQA